MKRFLVFALCMMMLVMSMACSKQGSNKGNDAAATPKPTPTPELVTINGTLVFADYGRVDFELYPQFAPQSALNFVYLAKQGYFNGAIIDRVSKKFCLEMGKYDNHMAAKEVPGGEYGIKGEFASNNVENKLGFGKGTMVWARDLDNPDSACNSFMIMLDTQSAQGLVGDYAPFGKISDDGMKIIKKIAKMKVEGEKPTKVVELVNVEINSTVEWPEPDFIRKAAKSDKAK